jgi:S-DNA-T family DNA segregation ATPase FtsK/SpoIIIE
MVILRALAWLYVGARWAVVLGVRFVRRFPLVSAGLAAVVLLVAVVPPLVSSLLGSLTAAGPLKGGAMVLLGLVGLYASYRLLPASLTGRLALWARFGFVGLRAYSKAHAVDHRFTVALSKSLVAAGACNEHGQVWPTVWDETAAGRIVEIRTPAGTPDASAHHLGDVMASDLHAWRCVRLASDRSGVVRFLLQDADPLAGDLVTDAPAASLVSLCCVGKLENGGLACVDLHAQTVLVGGSPGSGKSVFGWLLIAAAAADPSATVIVVDLKPEGVETAPVALRADFHVSTAIEAAAIFRGVLAEISRRNAELRKTFAEKVPKGSPDYPPIVIVVDEAAELTREGSDDGKDALVLLTRIVAVGRSAGVTVVLMTQKPDSSVVPTGLRDLFGQRVAFRTGNRAQAETIMGVLEPGVEPWNLSPASPGVGYLVGMDGQAQRFRSGFIDRARIVDEIRATEGPHQVWVAAHGQPIQAIAAPEKEPAPRTRRRRTENESE